MSLLQVSDLRFGYGGDLLFEGITFSIETGDRLALVAPNGAGKSSLLRLVSKELEPDRGSVVVAKGIEVAYYRQSHEIAAEGTVLRALLSGFADVLALRDELEKAQTDAASGLKEDLDRLAVATERHHQARADELEHKVSAIATRLGFTDLDRQISTLSGGERGRLNLGVVLAKNADLLLLDEPTNHLDLDTIGWLEEYLRGYRGGLLVVSHDRAFLDNVTSGTLELGSRGMRSYPLRYSDYVVAREEDLARERELASRQQAMVEKTEDFIRKNIAGQKTKQAQSRRKMLDKLERVERPEDVWALAERVSFRFAPAARSGDIVLDVKGAGAVRSGRRLFDDFEILLRRGERIGIVGPNGAGKTTLLRILAGRALEGDTGTVKRGTNLQEGYFDQHLGDVDTSLSAVDEVRRVRGDFTVEAARQYLARFRFWGDDPLRVVSGFSGGERSRLALAKLLLEPRNLLFLDEPTNHLDIAAAEILEEALTNFEGTVVFVSHDRRFLQSVATRIVEVRDGRATTFSGGFRDFMAERTAGRGAKSEGVRGKSARKTEPPKAPSSVAPASSAKGSYEEQKLAARERDRRKKRLTELEQLIASGEAQVAALRAQLKEDPAGNWEKLATMAREEQALTARVDAMMTEWAHLSEEQSHEKA